MYIKVYVYVWECIIASTCDRLLVAASYIIFTMSTNKGKTIILPKMQKYLSKTPSCAFIRSAIDYQNLLFLKWESTKSRFWISLFEVISSYEILVYIVK